MIGRIAPVHAATGIMHPDPAGKSFLLKHLQTVDRAPEHSTLPIYLLCPLSRQSERCNGTRDLIIRTLDIRCYRVFLTS